VSHTCYNRRMSEVASRELRNSTRSLLDRVESGGTITITVDGRPAAVLAPIGRRPRWVPRSEFTSTVLAHQADPGLAEDLDDLAGEMTDELPST
jgi:prevent-host-death family protein